MPGRLLERLILLFVLAGLLPQLALLWWGFELVSHFRLQYLAPALVLLVVALLAGRRWHGAALAAVMALNAWPVLPYLPLGAAAKIVPGTISAISESGIVPGTISPAADEIVVLNLNVNAGNRAHEQILDGIRRSGADLVTLIELGPALAARLGALGDVYPHRFAAPADDNFGLAVLSRHPLANPASFPLGATPAIAAGVVLPAGRLELIAVHPLPPLGAAMAAARNEALELLARRIRASEGPLLACGDFNLTPYSPYFSRFAASAGASDVRRGFAPGFSWPSFLPLAGIPIDHCFVRGPLAAERIERMEAAGSDHYPVRVTLRWQDRP